MLGVARAMSFGFPAEREPANDARLSRLLFEAREIVDMYKDIVEARGGSNSEDNYLARLRDDIDAYRTERGWSPDGFGNEAGNV
jgi:hypothetical protein